MQSTEEYQEPAVRTSKLDLLSEIKEDRIVLKFKDTCSSVASQIPLPRLLKEAHVLHTDRTSRTLFRHAMSPTKLYEARLKDMSNRARLTEIKVSLIKQKSILEGALSNVRKHILSKYGEGLKAVGSTAEMRRALLDRTLSSGLELISDIEVAADELDLYIKDIDQAAFGFRDATELIKLMVDRKEQVV